MHQTSEGGVMRERDLFIAALQKDDPAERAAYLSAACGLTGTPDGKHAVGGFQRALPVFDLGELARDGNDLLRGGQVPGRGAHCDRSLPAR